MVLFLDTQEVAKLCDAVSITAIVIAGQREVVSQCAEIYKRFRKQQSMHDDGDFTATLHILKTDLQHHQETIRALERTASRIFQLVSFVLSTLDIKSLIHDSLLRH